MRQTFAAVLGVIAGLMLLLMGAWALLRDGADGLRLRALRQIDATAFERQARIFFEQRHPGEKPLNWRIARVAEEFYHEEPMGRFVLHENDCSDFVGCVIDEALGVRARFNRGSDEHALCGEGGVEPRSLFAVQRLPRLGAVQPGDVVHVRHSPWYPPQDESIGHVGVVGPDGRIVDFTKLRSWSRARYNRVDFEFFTRHNAPEQVVIGRLRPEFRYRVFEIHPRGCDRILQVARSQRPRRSHRHFAERSER